MNFAERWGLYLALAALIITVGIAAYDFFGLYLQGKTTISESVWQTLSAWRDGGYRIRDFPVLTILLPAGASLQSIGLAIHLFAGLIRHNAERM
jgi:hypothetical protein